MNLRILVLVTTLLALSGCVSRPKTATGQFIGDAAVGGAVGTATYYLTDGNAGAAALAAAGAVGVKRIAEHVSAKSEEERMRQVAQTEHARATRDLYDAIQRQQAEPVQMASTDEDTGTYLPTQIPERTVNGVIIETSVEYIRINDQPQP